MTALMDRGVTRKGRPQQVRSAELSSHDPITLPCSVCACPLVRSDRRLCPRCLFRRRFPGQSMWGTL